MITCPACLHELDNPPVILRKRTKERADVEFYFCPRCDLVFHTEPIPADYYDAQYRQELEGVTTVTEEILNEQRNRAMALMPYLEPIVEKAGIFTSLDIGCGTGALPLMLWEKLRLDVAGVEPSIDYRAYARAQGLTVYPNLDDVTGKYDLVTCIHMLEHLREPRPFLEKLTRIARIVMIEVPNVMNCMGACGYVHPLAFNETSLYNLLAATGWAPGWILHYWGIYPNLKKPQYLLAVAAVGEADRTAAMAGSLSMGLSSYNTLMGPPPELTR